MFSFLPAFVTAFICSILLIVNTSILVPVLMVVSLFKVLIPIDNWRSFCSLVLVRIAETWISVNNFILWMTQNLDIEVEGLDGLQYRGWYLVVCNHQSWVDIVLLQKIFNRKIPFLKFFLKQQLIWVPLLGLAWWALDFPFMRRYSKDFLEKNPEMKGKDLEATHAACEKFKDIPVSIMNFVEGTRYTQEKHDKQNSPYRHLLKPKAGGVAFVTSSMGDIIHQLINVTIVYSGERPDFIDLLSGRVSKVKVIIEKQEIPAENLHGDYENDPEFQKKYRLWVSELWRKKDELMEKELTSLAK